MNKIKRVLFIFGTRPEAIKLAPLIKEFQKYKNAVDVKICVTGQHREMLDQVTNFFSIKPDFDLKVMRENQTLTSLTSTLITEIGKIFGQINPDITFVQGDTTTAFIGALLSFYNKVEVAHIEAGLRSYNKYSPFPEEINRVLVGRLANYHFAPTQSAKNNLLNEGINNNIWVVGNTVIDALYLGLSIIKSSKILEMEISQFFDSITKNKKSKIILVTGHRRESFGKPFENMCEALREIANKRENIEIIYPVHLNPNVRKPVSKILKNHNRIHLLEPLSYPYMIYLLSKSYLVLTDSGGIQEEAPSLGKPVLVMRNVTERQEGVKAGVAKLVGTDREKIVSETLKLIDNKDEYEKMSKAINPYGDGNTSKRIAEVFGLTNW